MWEAYPDTADREQYLREYFWSTCNDSITAADDGPLKRIPEDLDRIIIMLNLNGKRIPLCFDAYGTGVLDDQYCQQFEHSLDLDEVREEYPDQQSQKEYLTDYFWRSINSDLAHQLVGAHELVSDDLAEPDEHIYFKRGSEEELQRLLGLIAVTSHVPESAEVESRISYTDYDERDVVNQDYELDLEGLNSVAEGLIRLALERNQPRGWWRENDENLAHLAAYEEQWYEVAGVHLSYDLSDCLNASEAQCAQARHDLAAWLVELGRDPAEFGLASAA